MARIRFPIAPDLTDAQRSVHDAIIGGRRGQVPAPLLVWLTSPELASRAGRLGEFVRYETTLAARLSELAILLVAAHWNAPYEWAAHEGEAVKAGVDHRVIVDIACRRRPTFDATDERVVHDVVVSLQETHRVPDPLYREAVAALGERGVVELVGLVGYYTLIAMTLNVFEIEAPDA